jgi:peptidylglycine monooxygenase
MSSVIVALGRRRYRTDRGWARDSPETPLTVMSAIAHGTDGLVHVLRRSKPVLQSFDPAGTLVGSASDLVVEDGHGLFPAPDGSLWIADRDGHRILNVAPDGRILFSLGSAEDPAPFGPFGHPARAVVAPDGEVYVADGYADARIHRYAPDGRTLGSWGAPGIGPGEFRTPHSLWVTNQHVLVVDRDNDRVQVFDRVGAHLDTWTDFVHPMDIFCNAAGQFFITEDTPRLTMCGVDGTVLGRCRLPALQCHGITGDPAGNLYLTEVRSNMVTRLTLLDI